jgi:hypothetical protein
MVMKRFQIGTVRSGDTDQSAALSNCPNGENGLPGRNAMISTPARGSGRESNLGGRCRGPGKGLRDGVAVLWADIRRTLCCGRHPDHAQRHRIGLGLSGLSLAAGFTLGPLSRLASEVSQARNWTDDLVAGHLAHDEEPQEIGWITFVTLFIFILWMYQVWLLVALFLGLNVIPDPAAIHNRTADHQ